MQRKARGRLQRARPCCAGSRSRARARGSGGARPRASRRRSSTRPRRARGGWWLDAQRALQLLGLLLSPDTTKSEGYVDGLLRSRGQVIAGLADAYNRSATRGLELDEACWLVADLSAVLFPPTRRHDFWSESRKGFAAEGALLSPGPLAHAVLVVRKPADDGGDADDDDGDASDGDALFRGLCVHGRLLAAQEAARALRRRRPRRRRLRDAPAPPPRRRAARGLLRHRRRAVAARRARARKAPSRRARAAPEPPVSPKSPASVATTASPPGARARARGDGPQARPGRAVVARGVAAARGRAAGGRAAGARRDRARLLPDGDVRLARHAVGDVVEGARARRARVLPPRQERARVQVQARPRAAREELRARREALLLGVGAVRQAREGVARRARAAPAAQRALSVNAAEKIARLTSPFAPGAGGARFDELVAGAEPPAGVTRDGDGRLFTSDHHSLEGADAVVATGPDSARFDVRRMELARFLNIGGLAGSYAIALR